jgi:putative Holliday junction resolvase
VSVLLGIDLGERRIGIACGDTTSGGVLPLLTLRRSTPRQDAAAISRLCAERRVEAVVVGLPLHLDGTESEQSRRTREWVAAVHPALTVPLTFRDERLTSQWAEDRMGRPPRGRSGGPPSPAARRAWRARVDREAAAGIVQGELDARAAAGTEAGR